MKAMLAALLIALGAGPAGAQQTDQTNPYLEHMPSVPVQPYVPLTTTRWIDMAHLLPTRIIATVGADGIVQIDWKATEEMAADTSGDPAIQTLVAYAKALIAVRDGTWRELKQ